MGRTLAAAASMLGAVVLTPIAVGAVAPQLRADLDLTARALGLAVSCFWLATGASAAVGARHLGRWGWRPVASVALVVAACAQLGLGFANHGAVTLMLWLTLAGAAYGIVTPATNLVVADGVPERRHGVAIATKQGASPAAGVLAGLAVPLVVLTAGWPWMFALAAVLSLLALACTRLPRRGGHRTVPVEPAQVTGASRGRLPMWLVTLSAGLGTVPIGAILTFSVITLTASGLDPSTAGVVIAVSGAVAFCVRILLGWVVDVTGSDGVVPAGALLLAGAIANAALATGVPWLAVLGTVAGFTACQGWPALMLVGVLSHHRDDRAMASGRFQVGTAAGSAVGPFAFGMVSDHYGMTAAWTLVATCALASAVLILAARRRVTT